MKISKTKKSWKNLDRIQKINKSARIPTEKTHEQGLKRSEVPPFLGLKRSDRSNDMPA